MAKYCIQEQKSYISTFLLRNHVQPSRLRLRIADGSGFLWDNQIFGEASITKDDLLQQQIIFKSSQVPKVMHK